MSKTITSPSKRWPGSVTLSDPLTLPQAEAIENALDDRRDAVEEAETGEDGRVYFTITDKPCLPAVIACVEKWELEGFPDVVEVTSFPFSPRNAAHELIKWLFEEIIKIYSGESEVPNE